ncbi:MAG TPA: DUF6531 domain-containing protein [Candidatus Binatia bacterium]|jgi:YD repeat-containing protein|nr:DUF6531 domain-containing protein [Candidatus Binatia bacterium]
MSPNTPPGSRRPPSFHQRLIPLFLLTLLAFCAPRPAGADAPPTTLGIRFTGTDFEGRQSFQLQWNALANATYLVQTTSNLTSSAAWQTLDTVTPGDSNGLYQIQVVATDALGNPSPPAYYRLVLPQMQLLNVEPAISVTGAPLDLYLIGQSFGSNAVVSIGGVVQTNVQFISPTLLHVTGPAPTFTPDVPGGYDVQVVSGGQTSKLTYAWSLVSSPSSSVSLLEPPEYPPAGPAANLRRNPLVLVAGSTGASSSLAAGGGMTTDGGGWTALATREPGKRPLWGIGGNPSLSRAGGNPRDDDCDGFTAMDLPYDPPTSIKPPPNIDLKGAPLKLGTKPGTIFAGNGGEVQDCSPNRLMSMLGGGAGSSSGGASSGNMHLSPSSGEVQLEAVDLFIPGRALDFIWARTYRSRSTRFNTYGSPWTFSYDVRCVQNSSGGVEVYNGTGRKDTFLPQTNGTFTCPGFFSEGTLTSGVFRLTFADTGFWQFNPFDGTAQAGKLARIQDSNGNAMLLSYGSAGQLLQIVDDLGRTNSISYDASTGQVAGLTDFSGRTVAYSYYMGEPGGTFGDLKTVTSPPVTGTPNGNDFPSGKTNTYTYSSGSTSDVANHLLLSVADALGQTTVQCDYDLNPASASYLRCTGLQRWTNTPAIITYLPQTPSPSNQFAALRCIINDPLGNVSEGFYDARNRCVKLQEFTGRATAGLPVTDVSNRPTGKLRSTDPDLYETRWAWNRDSLCTLEVSPGGQQLQCAYSPDFDPSTPARKRADLRVLRQLATGPVDLDGDGIPDLVVRSWHYDYDPRFGSDPAGGYCVQYRESDLARGIVASKPGGMGGSARMAEGVWRYVPVRRMARAAGGRYARESFLCTAQASASLVRHARRLGYEPDPGTSGGYGFVTAASDPRGNTTTGSYDAAGNLARATAPFVVGNDPPVLDLAYNASGQLTTITKPVDANGRRRVDTITYYTNGTQQGYVHFTLTDSTSDPSSLDLRTTYEYDLRGNVTRCIDARSNDCLYTYNALDQCVQAQTPTNLSARCTSSFYYDANDNLVQSSTDLLDQTDSKVGVRTVLRGYDRLHRLTSIACAVDTTHSLTNQVLYDADDQCVLVLGGEAVAGTDSHQTISYQYDERGLLYRKVYAAGSTQQSSSQFDYMAIATKATPWKHHDIQGLEMPSLQRVTTYNYDGFGRPASIQDPMGHLISLYLDANDNLKLRRHFGGTNEVTSTDRSTRLAESSCDYDNLDRCVRTHERFFDTATQLPIGKGDKTTTFAFAPNDECFSVTDDLGRSSTFSYDNVGRILSVTDPATNRLEFTYDPLGNVLTTTARQFSTLGGPEQDFSATNIYDALSRCVSSVDNVGNTNRYAYDSLDRVVTFFNPREYTVSYTYDLLDRCTLAIGDLDGDGFPDLVHDQFSQAVWSSNSGRLLATIDSHTNSTTYAYDALDRCALVTSPNGTPHTFAWNSLSDLASQQDPNGTVVLHTYDFDGRCISNNINPGPGVSSSTTVETFQYDGLSRLVHHHDDACDGDFTYNSLGDCTRETLNGLATSSTYDSLGNQLSLTYPGGRALSYTYDSLNRCSSIVDSGAVLASFDYDGPNRLSRVSFANKMRTRIFYDGISGTPNAPGDFGLGQVRSIRHAASGGLPVINDASFAWDRNGNKTARTVTIPSPTPRTNSMTLAYDPLDRLTTVSVASNSLPVRLTTYSLDRVGNRTNVSGEPCFGPYTLSPLVPPGDFQMNRYTATPCDSRTYDNNGNLIARGLSTGDTLSYTYDGCDRLVGVSLSGVAVAAYAYDALGRRISKTVFSGGLPPDTTLFLYDGTEVIEERDHGVTSATYVCRKGEPVETDKDCGGPSLMTRAGQTYYVHPDDQGNVLALTEAAGNVVERYEYDDFGAVTFLTSDGSPTSATASSVGNPYLFGGLRLDPETGLHCDDGSCYLDPLSGRYILRAGVPLAFADNNPWSASPPKGKTPMERIDINGAIRLAASPGSSRRAKTSEAQSNLRTASPSLGLQPLGGDILFNASSVPLKSHFQNGDIPTQDQFSKLVGGLSHGSESLSRIKRALAIEMERRSGGF